MKEYLEYAALAALILGMAAVAASQMGLWQREPGSFEYIRKGEDLLQKGSLKESIGYFEKAYDSSPQNKDIRSSLVYAHSRYSIALAASGNYDGAIEYLTRAADVEPGTNTMQNLAAMYARRGVSKARKGGLASARRDFETAREAAAYSETASRNLGIILYNEAASEFKASRYELAIMFLKESALACEADYAFELLGDICYKKTDFETAHFYFDKAAQANPQNSSARAKSQKAAKEFELSRDEESTILPHFEVRHSRGAGVDIETLRRILERCYLEVGKDLAYFPDSSTLIIFYSNADFRRIFDMPQAVRAFYDGNIRIPLPEVPLQSRIFTDYIYHEYTHAVVSAKTEGNCPAWLNEGLAMWEEYKDKNDIILDLIISLIDKDQLSLSALEKAFDVGKKEAKDPRLYYLLAYSVVKYMIDNWGLEGMRRILDRIRGGQHVINAIDDEFLLSEKEFERRWQDYVIEKFLRK